MLICSIGSVARGAAVWDPWQMQLSVVALYRATMLRLCCSEVKILMIV